LVEYVVYYRVSTERQGRSGLGLDAQRSMVDRFIQPTDTITAEFTEIESGKNDKRPELWKAISLVKKTKAKLLIPKLDRFSRKVSFISGIIDQGIELVVCEHPNVSTFFLHLLACFAEEERRQISERTRAALAEARKQQKRQFVEANLSAFRAIWDQAPSASVAARRLNDAKLETPKGTKWYPATVLSFAAVAGLIPVSVKELSYQETAASVPSETALGRLDV
jgi:DNA invertase Pin-like site-specific DNA recombinase